MTGHARTDRTRLHAREDFLKSLAAGLSVTGSCARAGIPKRTMYDWRAADEEFKAAWDEALDSGSDILEDEAFRRAHDGVEEPVVAQGKVIFTVRKYSDTLMVTLLKARRPEKFRERLEQKLTGDKENPVAIEDVSARELIASRVARLAARVRPGGDPGQSDGSAS